MTKNKYTNLLLQTLGCFISAAGIYSFAVAAEVPVTGIAGICAILYRLFGIPMGLSNVLINIPIILCTYKLLGKSFFIRSVYCMVLFAFFTDYLLPLMPVYQGDRLLATICGGVVGGIGDALIYMNNSSTGGLDFITMGIKAKHPHLPLGRFIMLTDGIVVVLGGIIFRDFDGIVYGMMIDLIFAVIADKIMYGANAGKLALIVTDHGEAVTERIDELCGRGTTIIDARGGFRKDHRDVVLCACSGKEMFTITREVKLLDPASFTIILESNEVHGEGFRMLRVAEPHAGDEK